MRSGRAPVEPQPYGLFGQRFDMARCRIVGLVAMEIHPEAARRRDLAERAHRLRAVGCRPLEVGDAADHLDALVESARHGLHVAGPSQIAVLREGDELDVEALLHRLPDVKEGFHADQRGIGDIDVGADREQGPAQPPKSSIRVPARRSTRRSVPASAHPRARSPRVAFRSGCDADSRR